MKRKPRYFIYRTGPFRPLFHEHWFQEPRSLREAIRKPAHIWWFIDRSLVQRMVKEFNRVEPTSYATQADYVRISGGGQPFAEKPKRNATINDL